MKSSEANFANEIRALCTDEARNKTAYVIAAETAAGSVEKVIAAEAYLKDAALSLGHEQKLTALLSELHDVAEALSMCYRASDRPAVPASAVVESMKPALPQWWFALSEMLEATDREIEFLASIGRGQPREAPPRMLCNLVIRLLRKHYQSMLEEAEEWMSMKND